MRQSTRLSMTKPFVSVMLSPTKTSDGNDVKQLNSASQNITHVCRVMLAFVWRKSHSHMMLVKPCSTKFTLCHCIRAYVIILLYCEETDMKCVMKCVLH